MFASQGQVLACVCTSMLWRTLVRVCCGVAQLHIQGNSAVELSCGPVWHGSSFESCGEDN